MFLRRWELCQRVQYQVKNLLENVNDICYNASLNKII